MSSDTVTKRSPLHEAHQQLGAKMVPFAGWEMPVQYTAIMEEHRAVRTAVGVFDISHMGQFLVDGDGAEAFLNHALTNNVARLADRDGQYTLMLNDNGGVIDDLIAYRLEKERYFLVVNASMIDVDRDHLFSLMARDHAEDVILTDISAQTGGLAIQGPLSRQVFHAVFGAEAVYPERNTIVTQTERDGGSLLYFCGTGYTGEEGFEFFAPAGEMTRWFHLLVDAARAAGGGPAGLGSRDTLRLEMGYPLNGNDLSPSRSPLEAGLGYFVDLAKGEFVGRMFLEKQKASGVPSRLAGFRLTVTGPPLRAHYPIWHEEKMVGETCSGGLSPSLGYGIGMAYLPPDLATPGTALEIEIRGRRFAAETVKKPFYRKPQAITQS